MFQLPCHELGFSLQEVAAHEAGHITVAYALGLRPKVVYLTVDQEQRHTGKADYTSRLGEERAAILSVLAGLLAQAKNLAERAAGVGVQFGAAQDWLAVALCFTGESCGAAPVLTFDAKNGTSIGVSMGNIWHFQIDAQKARVLAVGNSRDPAGAALEPAFRHCSALLDSPDVWSGVTALASALGRAPVAYRLLEEAEIMGHMTEVRIHSLSEND